MTSRGFRRIAGTCILLSACGETLADPGVDPPATSDAAADASDASVAPADDSGTSDVAIPDTGPPPYVKPSCYFAGDAMAPSGTIEVTPNAPKTSEPLTFIAQSSTGYTNVQFRLCIEDGGLISVVDGPIDQGTPKKWFYNAPQGLSAGWRQAQFRGADGNDAGVRATLDFYVAP